MATRYGVFSDPRNSSLNDWRDELEEWSSLKAAKASLYRRWRHQYDYVSRVDMDDDGILTHHVSDYTLFPCLSSECQIKLFDLASGEPYMRLTLGPRGGIRQENL